VDLHAAGAADARFRAYASKVTSVLGHADRVKPFEDYCIGLISAEGRKSVEPLAAVTAPERTAAQHQSLLHLVAQAPWSDAAILRRVRERVLPSVTREEPIQAWIIDDTGYPKKGRHSVGMARQYCGQVGKQENCQTAVSLSIATHQASLSVAYRLYLPKEWADDAARRSKAGVPEDVTFQTKLEIAFILQAAQRRSAQWGRSSLRSQRAPVGFANHRVFSSSASFRATTSGTVTPVRQSSIGCTSLLRYCGSRS
jgi:SRSO17 transposase